MARPAKGHQKKCEAIKRSPENLAFRLTVCWFAGGGKKHFSHGHGFTRAITTCPKRLEMGAPPRFCSPSLHKTPLTRKHSPENPDQKTLQRGFPGLCRNFSGTSIQHAQTLQMHAQWSIIQFLGPVAAQSKW